MAFSYPNKDIKIIILNFSLLNTRIQLISLLKNLFLIYFFKYYLMYHKSKEILNKYYNKKLKYKKG